MARVVDIAMYIDPKRIRRAREGSGDSARVGVPWHIFIELLDAVEEARPGWIDRTRQVVAQRNEAQPPDRRGYPMYGPER